MKRAKACCGASTTFGSAWGDFAQTERRYIVLLCYWVDEGICEFFSFFGLLLSILYFVKLRIDFYFLILTSCAEIDIYFVLICVSK